MALAKVCDVTEDKKERPSHLPGKSDVEEKIEGRVGDEGSEVGRREVGFGQPGRHADALHHHRQLADDKDESDGRDQVLKVVRALPNPRRVGRRRRRRRRRRRPGNRRPHSPRHRRQRQRRFTSIFLCRWRIGKSREAGKGEGGGSGKYIYASALFFFGQRLRREQ